VDYALIPRGTGVQWGHVVAEGGGNPTRFLTGYMMYLTIKNTSLEDRYSQLALTNEIFCNKVIKISSF